MEEMGDDEILSAAMALEDLKKNKQADSLALEDVMKSRSTEATTMEGIRKDREVDAQSSSDKNKLQGRPFEMHAEQREEEASTRHSVFDFSQRTQGVGMTCPPLKTDAARFRRRSTIDGTLGGIISRKRKHCDQEEYDDSRPLSTQDGREGEYHGYRDEAEERGTKCYKPSYDGTCIDKTMQDEE
jgi:hypothetical protein